MNVYEQLADPLALGVFVLTLVLPVLVGLAVLARTRSQSDFFVGGRAMGKIVVALSAVSSGRSSWLVLGVSGIAFTMGASAVWAILGYTVVEYVQCVTIGPRLRRAAERYDSITLLDYLESRFGGRGRSIRLVGAAIIALFVTAYVAAQLNAGAKTLASALDWSFGAGLVASLLMILVYMVLGGYVAVAYNDAVRAVIMLFGLLVLPLAALASAGGPAAVVALLRQLDPSLLDPAALGLGAFVGFVGIGLGSPGQPHILVRYMSIDDAANLRASALVGAVWNLALGLGAVAVGMVGRALVADPASLPGGDPELIYLVLAAGQFGPLLFGALVGGIFAAILSTADSQLLVVASTFVRDLWEQVLRRDRPAVERDRLRMSRWVVVLAGLAAALMAMVAQDLVFWLVLFAWGGLGAAFGPALILSLYWPRTTRAGVVAGMLAGALLVVVWRLWLKEPTGVYELVPAFLGSLAVVVAVSLSTSRRS
jgi:sodium/proline symporter